MTHQFRSRWAIGDRVRVDEDRDLVGRVTRIMWVAPEVYQVEVSWMHNGAVQAFWLDPWRLTESTKGGVGE